MVIYSQLQMTTTRRRAMRYFRLWADGKLVREFTALKHQGPRWAEKFLARSNHQTCLLDVFLRSGGYHEFSVTVSKE